MKTWKCLAFVFVLTFLGVIVAFTGCKNDAVTEDHIDDIIGKWYSFSGTADYDWGNFIPLYNKRKYYYRGTATFEISDTNPTFTLTLSNGTGAFFIWNIYKI